MTTAMTIRRLGRLGWDRALMIQKDTMQRVASGQQGSTLLLCEHDPVYTMGRRQSPEPEEVARLEALGASVFHSKRGGLITFHGPGQLVGYPIFDIRSLKVGAKDYVRGLEESIISVCGQYGIEAETTCDTGVWVGNAKVAAIGVQISRGITQHGFALNCNTDLTWFDNIVPCGLPGKQVTSLSKLTENEVSIEDATPLVIEALASKFNLEVEEQMDTPH